MVWTAEALAQDGLIILEYSGLIHSGEVEASAMETLRLAAETGITRVLADCSSMSIGGHTILDLALLIDWMSEMNYRHISEAIVAPPGAPASENVDFWVLAAKNRGFNLRRFETREAALAWLATTP
ncbi:protein of unknown function [Magnetospirillum sp. XM-1]|uniref:hypothetical protein n=1 Tax=Magnetospirillum sp. XM-1 TaxID=1663591 RepID=UPI00073DCDF4|nr:hypothetical protein [Magnetospirillum sp. XM-1]CUW40673.1 protein of unknown function [Magnetospirillum sp. XM-1]